MAVINIGVAPGCHKQSEIHFSKLTLIKFCWHCHTTSHSTTSRLMNSSKRWYSYCYYVIRCSLFSIFSPCSTVTQLVILPPHVSWIVPRGGILLLRCSLFSIFSPCSLDTDCCAFSSKPALTHWDSVVCM